MRTVAAPPNRIVGFEALGVTVVRLHDGDDVEPAPAAFVPTIVRSEDGRSDEDDRGVSSPNQVQKLGGAKDPAAPFLQSPKLSDITA